MSDLLNLRKVGAAYGKSQVLWDIDLDIVPGSSAAIIGRNGVGKTTLLKTIMGMHKVGEGQILINGEDVTKMRAHERGLGAAAGLPHRHVPGCGPLLRHHARQLRQA